MGMTATAVRDFLTTLMDDGQHYVLIQEEKKRRSTQRRVYNTLGGCVEYRIHPVTGKIRREADGEAIRRETLEETSGRVDLRQTKLLVRDEDTAQTAILFMHSIMWKRPVEAPRKLPPANEAGPHLLPGGSPGNYALAPPPPPMSVDARSALYGEEIDLNSLENNESVGHRWIPVISFLNALHFVHRNTARSSPLSRDMVIERASRQILGLDGILLALNLRRESPIFKKLMSLAGMGQ
jgi:ADP-ribose pyrophosphatase YjhB (NUDIX family)